MVKRCLLGVGVIIGIFAFNSTSAYADDVNMSVNLAASAALVLPSTPVNLAIQPTAEGRFSSDSFNVTAYSNSPAGYTLTMTTTSVDLTSDTYNAATETYPVISTLSDSVTASNFELNKWGISLDGGTTYVPMTTERTLADTTSTGALANGEVTTIGIGAKLDLETVPGKYSTTINFLLVAQPLPTDLEASYGAAGKSKVSIPGGGSYYSMQDMTSEICANSTESELQVVDTRDNKVYWILKAKDGKCWMTQNLDLNIDANTTYTHADTDLGWGSDTETQSWKPIHSTIDISSGNTSSWENDTTYPYSADPGNWYWTDTWVENAGDQNYILNPSAYYKTNPFPGNGEHGHLGNYYNWPAAVASNNADIYNDEDTFDDISKNAQNSICPAGWRLPTTSSVAQYDEYNVLFTAYNAYSDPQYERDRTVLAAPLYLVRSGILWDSHKSLTANIGYLWTSTSSFYHGTYDDGPGYAYSTYFDYYGITTDYSTDSSGCARDQGLSIRCVAR